ncbi:hypothetical protein Taro_036850 [Colocasia esculenta]|uniref:Uncharacterized protein n=1 Tax=Colocasia esculenta TaxID=4460 RepID=A0A843WEJ1_COLES|nr:hypothetical protein [Colocasia esculenta]
MLQYWMMKPPMFMDDENELCYAQLIFRQWKNLPSSATASELEQEFKNFGRIKRDGVLIKSRKESYEQQLIERHGDDSSQHPQFDASARLVAAGQPKKGQVFGFGTGMDVGGVVNSTMESGCSAASYSYAQSPPPLQQPTKLPDHYCSALIRQLDSWFGRTVVPALHAMGVAFPPPPPSPSTAGFDQVVREHASNDADGDDLETHLADD